MMPVIPLSEAAANRLLQLLDFAMRVADVTGNTGVKMAAIEAIAELLAEGRKMPKVQDAGN
jgi:hypothetical protein